MPAPKPLTVVLILAVFAIVALYVLGLGLGATDDTRPGGSSPMTAEERGRWRERLLKPRPVKAEEVKAECPFVSGVLTVEPGRSCRLIIDETGARARTVEVVRLGAGTVGLGFKSNSKQAFPLSVANLTSARKLDVAKEGAELVISCAAVGGQRCQVRLQ